MAVGDELQTVEVDFGPVGLDGTFEQLLTTLYEEKIKPLLDQKEAEGKLLRVRFQCPVKVGPVAFREPGVDDEDDEDANMDLMSFASVRRATEEEVEETGKAYIPVPLFIVQLPMCGFLDYETIYEWMTSRLRKEYLGVDDDEESDDEVF